MLPGNRLQLQRHEFVDAVALANTMDVAFTFLTCVCRNLVSVRGHKTHEGPVVLAFEVCLEGPRGLDFVRRPKTFDSLSLVSFAAESAGPVP